jgi:TonB family protein
MNAILLYVGKSALCFLVMYSVYWFFLKRDTFFQVNRFYLLAALFFSMVFPLVPLHWTPADPSTSLVVMLEPILITPAKVKLTMQDHLQWIDIAAVVYFTGVIIFLLRFGLQLIQLNRITRRFGISECNGHRVVFVDRGYSPFSFFNLVFINKEMMSDKIVSTILRHEQVHIRQHHTYDMILIELATILQWFNPIIWLASREMKSIHEYLADEGVLQNGISPSLYQQMILNETMGIQVNNLTNNFNVSLLKKRIVMMTKSKSKRWAKSKVLIALPVLMILLLILTVRSYSNADELKAAIPVFAPVHELLIPSPVPQEKKKPVEQVKFTAPVVTDKDKDVFTVVEKLPSYPGGDEARAKFLRENIHYPEVAMKNKIQGKVFVTFVVRADGSVTDAKVLRGIGSGCDEEALRVIKMMPKWNPGTEKGVPVNVQFNLPIKFTLDTHKKGEPKK